MSYVVSGSVFVSTSHKHSIATILAKDKQKKKGKYYTAPYYNCGCFGESLYTTSVDNKIFHDVQTMPVNRTGMVDKRYRL